MFAFEYANKTTTKAWCKRVHWIAFSTSSKIKCETDQTNQPINFHWNRYERDFAHKIYSKFEHTSSIMLFFLWRTAIFIAFWQIHKSHLTNVKICFISSCFFFFLQVNELHNDLIYCDHELEHRSSSTFNEWTKDNFDQVQNNRIFIV